MFKFVISDKNLLHYLNNHPVHLVDETLELSPSAFIPFCSFGNDIESMTMKIENFSLPVCYSFKAVVHKDQLCYQVDLESFKSKENLKEQILNGLVLILDNNEDRNMLSSDTSSMDQGYISVDTISMKKIILIDGVHFAIYLQKKFK